MAYTSKLAVINPTTPEIDLYLTEVVIPEVPITMIGQNSATTVPSWQNSNLEPGGVVPTTVSISDGAVLTTFAYTSDTAIEGIRAFGVGARDHGIRSAGTIAEFTTGTFCTYIGQTFMGVQIDAGATSTTAEITSIVQTLGDFSGGEHGLVSLNATNTDTHDFGFDLDNIGGGDFQYVAWTWAAPSAASTTNDPEALFVFSANLTQTSGPGLLGQCTVGALKLTADGTLSQIGLFQYDDQYYNEDCAILAHVGDGTQHYFVADAIANIDDVLEVGAPDSIDCVLATCQEQAWPPTAYTVEHIGFDDPDLPTFLESLIYSYEEIGGGNEDPRFFGYHLCGCSLGFILSYSAWNGSTQWEPKFLLISKDWATFQRLNITGDVVCDAILAQGIYTDYPANDYTLSMINLTYDDTTARWSLLGGSLAEPLLVQSEAEDEGGIVDEELNLRVWGFKLDDHAVAVFRLGPSETLVYDRTTRQWSEWQSPGLDYWRAHIGQNWVGMSSTTFANDFGTDIVAGDSETGILWILDPTAGQDDDPTTGEPTNFPRKVIGGVPLNGRETAGCGAVTLELSRGQPVELDGTITLRTSDDRGHNWISHGEITIEAGDYDAVVEWRGLGLMKSPGRIFEFSDDGAVMTLHAADLR